MNPNIDDWADSRPAPDLREISRHGARSSADLEAILTYRNTPDHLPEAMQSNWSVEPNAVSEVITEDRRHGVGEHLIFHAELSLEITPSTQQVLRAMRHDWEENGAGQVVAIGPLRFSDGTQTERAYRLTADGGVEAYDRVMPAGAMLGTVERLGSPLGGKVQSEAVVSNSALEKKLGVTRHTWTRGKRKKRGGKSYTAAESRDLLAEAIANTRNMPPVTKCPPGVASAIPRYADQFIGMKIARTGKGGAINWEDIYIATRDREEWLAAIGELGEQTLATLEAAMTARNISELGMSGHRRTRERQGWKALRAANDNLKEKLEKFAA